MIVPRPTLSAPSMDTASAPGTGLEMQPAGDKVGVENPTPMSLMVVNQQVDLLLQYSQSGWIDVCCC